MSCLELGPRRSGFRVGRDRFSGEEGRSMAFAPLPGRPKTVPSRRKPPKPLLGGGPIGILGLLLFGKYLNHIPIPVLEDVEYGLGLSLASFSRGRDGVADCKGA